MGLDPAVLTYGPSGADSNAHALNDMGHSRVDADNVSRTSIGPESLCRSMVGLSDFSKAKVKTTGFIRARVEPQQEQRETSWHEQRQG